MSFFRSPEWEGASQADGILSGAALNALKKTRAFQVVASGWAAGLRPPTDLAVSEWAEQHRYVSPPTPNPGPWRNERTPYLTAVMDTLSPQHPAREIDVMKGTQLGFTEAALNVVGYYSQQCPGTTGMLVLPTKGVATEWAKFRLQSLFEYTEPLKVLVSHQNNRRSSKANTTFAKQLANGVTWKIAWSSSANLLRSTPAGLILADEVDGMSKSVGKEGNTIDVLRNRFANYRRGKFLRISSPTNRHTSLIEGGFKDGDQRYDFLPCPFCNWCQRLVFDQFIWPDGHPEEIAYRCIACEKLIPEHWKPQMLTAGQWLATKQAQHLVKTGFASDKLSDYSHILAQMEEAEHPSFHLASFYAPLGWYSWRTFGFDWVNSDKDQEKRKVVIMTKLGETWIDRGEAPDWEKIYLRRERYEESLVPVGVLFLVAGVDVQADRLEIELVGYGRGKESWSICYAVIQGDTSTEEPWKLLDEFLATDWPSVDSRSLPIMVMAIDTGFRPQNVYEFAKRHAQAAHSQAGTRIAAARTVVPVKGNSDAYKIIAGLSSSDAARKRGGLRIVTVGTAAAKQDIYDCLRLPAPTKHGEAYPPGYCHFPFTYESDYFQGLTSESRVVRINNKIEWVKDPMVRNEPLDCRVYARAAATLYGIDRFTDTQWKKLGWDPTRQIVLNFVVDDDGDDAASLEGSAAPPEAVPNTVSQPAVADPPAEAKPRRAPKPRRASSKYLSS